MRLIDADALKTKFENKKSTIQNRIMGVQMDSIAIAFYEIFIEAIDKQPTVDAVPVVRCIECKYRGGNCGDIDSDRWCYQIQRYVDLDWFCADGERKDGEG